MVKKDDYSKMFLDKNLLNLSLVCNDHSSNSLIKRICFKVSKNHINYGRPLQIKELQAINSIILSWKTQLSHGFVLDSEVNLKHASEIKFILSKSFEELDVKVSTFWNLADFYKNFIELHLKHSITKYSHLTILFRKMLKTSSDTMKIAVKNKTRLLPYFDQLRLNFELINRLDRQDLELLIHFFAVSQINRGFRHAFECKFSNKNIFRPELKLDLRWEQKDFFKAKAVWELNAFRQKNIVSLITILPLAPKFSWNCKLTSKREVESSFYYSFKEKVSLIQSTRLEYQSYKLGQNFVSFGFGFRAEV